MKAIKADVTKALPVGSEVETCDNSGAKVLRIFTVVGLKTTKGRRSAAGVAVMGVRRDIYTFSAHLKWMPAITLGYFLSAVSWVFIAKWLY